jgi:hypothetical protein
VEGDENPCFLPDFKVERIANMVLLHCKTEDDGIILWEIFKELSTGKPLWIGKAKDDENQ